jgi:hypothetical protein
MLWFAKGIIEALVNSLHTWYVKGSFKGAH